MERLKSLHLFAAPILLVGVALLQIYRAHAFDQSPWKGGGFGMFSTTDSPGARYVRAFLVTVDGMDLEVPLLPSGKGIEQRLRVSPSRELLERIADAMLAQTWLWADYDPMRGLLSPRETAAAVAASYRPTAEQRAADLPESGIYRPEDQPRARLLGSGEPPPPEAARVPVARARVELWRISFEARSNRLSTYRFMVASADAGDRSDAEAALTAR